MSFLCMLISQEMKLSLAYSHKKHARFEVSRKMTVLRTISHIEGKPWNFQEESLWNISFKWARTIMLNEKDFMEFDIIFFYHAHTRKLRLHLNGWVTACALLLLLESFLLSHWAAVGLLFDCNIKLSKTVWHRLRFFISLLLTCLDAHWA